MLRRLSYLLFAVSVVLLAGCKKERHDPQVAIQILGPSTLTTSAAATHLEVQITCEGRWEVELPADTRWLIALPLKGNGDATLSLDIAANPADQRATTLRLFTATADAHLSILQQQKDGGSTPPIDENPPVTTRPVVTTIEASALEANSARVGVSYVYPFSSPAIAEVGVMWRSAGQVDYPELQRITSATPSQTPFSATIEQLAQRTTYYYKGYVITSDLQIYYGEERSFTTAQGYVAPPSVAQFYDDFSSGTDGWIFHSTGPGWTLTQSAQLGSHLICYPVTSPDAQVVSYAMLPPIDVSRAPAKRMAWEIAWDFVSADATKLELVASSDFAGDFQKASWSSVRNISLRSGTHARGEWVAGEVDLSTLAYQRQLFFAFRYTGKSIAYRLGKVSVGYAAGSAVDPSEPATPRVTWGAPTISGDFEQNQFGSATLRIAYDSPSARRVSGVSITPSGVAAAGFETLTGLEASLGQGAGELVFTLSGKPTAAGAALFTIDGLPDLTAPDNRVQIYVKAASVTPIDPEPDPTPGPEPDPDPTPISLTWDLSAIAAGNWEEHVPACLISPTATGSLRTVGNLTQRGAGWEEYAKPADGRWGGSGFVDNSAGNPIQYVSFSVRSDSRRISLKALSISEIKQGVGQTLLLVKVGGNDWQQVGFDLSGVAALQRVAVGTLIELRLVPTGAVARQATWYLTGAVTLSATEE